MLDTETREKRNSRLYTPLLGIPRSATPTITETPNPRTWLTPTIYWFHQPFSDRSPCRDKSSFFFSLNFDTAVATSMTRAPTKSFESSKTGTTAQRGRFHALSLETTVSSTMPSPKLGRTTGAKVGSMGGSLRHWPVANRVGNPLRGATQHLCDG